MLKSRLNLVLAVLLGAASCEARKLLQTGFLGPDLAVTSFLTRRPIVADEPPAEDYEPPSEYPLVLFGGRRPRVFPRFPGMVEGGAPPNG